MLFIATPCLDNVLLKYHLSIVNLIGYLGAKQIPYQYATLTDCNSMRSRAELTSAFLQSGYEYMLQIDSDMEFSPEDVIRLLSHKGKIVAGVYPKRKMRWDLLLKGLEKGDPRYKCYGEYTFVAEKDSFIEENGLMKVKYAPSGFWIIHRNVIKTMITRYPQLEFKSAQYEKSYALYDNIIGENGRYLSADYSFCERATQCDIPIYVDMHLKLNHVGTHSFDGDPMTCVVQ